MTFLEAVSAAQGGALIRPVGCVLMFDAFSFDGNGWKECYMSRYSIFPRSSTARLPHPEMLAGPWECVTWEQLEEERRS